MTEFVNGRGEEDLGEPEGWIEEVVAEIMEHVRSGKSFMIALDSRMKPDDVTYFRNLLHQAGVDTVIPQDN